MTASGEVIEWGHERARAARWRGEPHVAYLAPVPGSPTPSPGFVGRCLDALRLRGFSEVITGALAPTEQRGFLAAGFRVREHLVLLARDLDGDLPGAARGTWRLRSARRWDRTAVLAVDHAAFRPFWRLDGAGLDEALRATPSTRFRVAGRPGLAGGGVVGYAVSGRAGRRGYLQRLAVDPSSQGTGIGAALVLDALGWMRHRAVERAMVNTQPDNEPALALYDRLGFLPQPGGLDVLTCRLDG